jgi:hypothetical protein
MKTKIKSVRIKFDKVRGETAKAVLLYIFGQELWFPRRFLFGLTVNNKLGGHASIPTWLYKEKFGEEPCEDDADEVVEHHVPTRIEPTNMQPDGELTR